MIKKIVVGALETNCYLFYDEKSKEGIVIDPGADSEKIIEQIKDLKLQIKWIVNTHGHGDHVGACSELKEFTQAKLLIHKLDLPWFDFFSSASPDAYLEDNQMINIGNYFLKVLYTPGHSEGSVSLLQVDQSGAQIDDGFVFTGDTLFCEAVGRSDLPGGDEKKLFVSLKEKLLILPEQTVFYPGHGPECTIGEEKKHNPFL
jgi:glyoxylase-like metal-dependent hydrolase (beta-lactamase superfamily II)